MQAFYGATQAYDAATGERLWRANLGGSLQSTPVVTDEAIFLATYPGVIYALR
jgi:outer membrane protein assembly factor BamB